MRLSLVIAAYNEGEALVKTVQSCVETCAGLDYEIIVADDASWDGSVEEVAKRFPRLRIVRNVERLGASPTKDRGARAAAGEVLIFLDGHAKPERNALRRLAEDVQFLKGRAVVTPTIVTLDVARWRNAAVSRGHGYRVDLETFRSDWLPLSDLRAVHEGPRTFYESPAAIGCAFAVTRELYETLWGFDPDMRYWGVEDVDFSLKCWLMGFPILHDPEPVVGHRFQRSFDNYSVPPEQLTANLLRMARKNFTHTAWEAWVAQRRKEHPEGLPDHPEGLWTHAWQVFESRRASAEEERAYLLARRVRDEFWYAERFGLNWPRLRGTEVVPAGRREAAALTMGASPSPSPSPPPPPPEPDPEPPCEGDEECCECGCSSEPVRYFNGEVQISATDLSMGGYGKVWRQRRVYSNRLSFNGDVGQGYNWLVEQWPYLIEHADGSVTVVRGVRKTLWFDLVEGNYVGRYGAKSTLTHDADNHRFVLTLPGGEQWRFHDFDQVANPPGLFASQVTRGGQVTSVTSYTADERIEEIERSATVDGNAVTQAFRYAYDTEGRTTSVTLRQRVNAGTWTDIRRVLYEYYADVESFGSEGDLKRARLQVPQESAWADSEIDYYRYYKSEEAHGFEHGLKYVVGPKAYARMAADGIDPLTASNGQIAQYADHYFEYDANRRATKEAVAGGSRLFTFAYTTSSFSDGYNNWKVKTVETRPDGSQVIVYTNFIGQILIKELTDGTDRWIESRQYDSEGRKIQQASPSVVTGYDDSSANLNVSLRANDGLIHVTDYYAATGGVAVKGYVQFQKIKRGSAGTEIKQAGFEYASHSAGGITVHPISKQTVYRHENGTGAIETSFSYTWHAGTVQIQQQTQTLPVVPTSQNGSGVAATRREYFDIHGNRTWMMDERGFITGWKYDVPTGAATQRIDDVDTSVETDAPGGWTTPSGGGLNLVTDYEHDDLGRQTQELGPEHMLDIGGTATAVRRATWTVYRDVAHEVRVGRGYQRVSDSSFTLINPVSIAKRDARGNVLEEIQAVRSSTSGKLQPTDSFPQSSYVGWTTYQYTDCCLAASMRVYHAIPASGEGTEGVNYDQTRYGYDVMKRRNCTVSPGGTITFDVFDVRGLVVATYVGTNDDGATQSDPTGGGTDPDNNMVLVTENEYDDGQDGEDGNLTQQVKHVDGSTTRVTAFTYDWRNRRTDIDGEIDFYQKTFYDNLDQVVKTERYDTTSSGNLIARQETLFDNRRRIYRTIRWGVDPTTGTVGNSLADNTWYDATGNLLKALPSGSNLFTKSVYDSLGRMTARYVGYDADETSYSDVGSVTDDVILEQIETAYDDASNAIQVTKRQRYHNASGTQLGALGNPSTNPKARVTSVAFWQDVLGREIANANYGTNGGPPLSRPAIIPAWSDAVLVTTTVYDGSGLVELTTDPAGVATKFGYDDAGRETERIGNFQGSSPSTSACDPSADVNVTVRTAYNADGNVKSLTAVNVDTGDQVTQYVYGTTLANSEIASSLLKRAEIYPDSTGGSDQVEFAYNRQQQVTQVTDQGGTIHAYDYDKLGRQTQDRVTALGFGVDSAVRRIATIYELRGLRATITSYDQPTVGIGTVLNQSQFVYNEFGQLVAEYQAHSGTVNPSTTPQVQYGYANGAANTIRPTELTYPNGRVLTFSYGDAGSLSDNVSRIVSIIDEDDTHLVDYDYLGQGTFIVANDTEPDVKWTLVSLTGSNDPDTGDIYTGLDRFGRIKDNRWYDDGSSANIDRIQYGYDRAGNRLWRHNVVASALNAEFDELYRYDGIQRLKDMQRGTLNTPRTALSSETFAQCWTLDSTGNWQGFREDDAGDGTWDLIQARTANKVNEITGISETAGPSWITPAYSPAGNMTTLPQPADPTAGYAGTYDAWNRLVQIADGSDTVSEYVYDGARRRILQKSYTGGTLTETRHLYYTQPSQWQVLEERVGTSTDADRQFVWGLRYLDDCVLRDRDTNANGSRDERLYALQDANWNVTALVDTAGDVQERYAYSTYGVPLFLTPTFGSRAASSFDWETLYCGYRYETLTRLLHVRNRIYITILGTWGQRDPLGYLDAVNLYLYSIANPLRHTDGFGMQSSAHPPGTVIVITPGGETKVFPPNTDPGVVQGYINGHPNSQVIRVGPTGIIPPPPEELRPFLPRPAPPRQPGPCEKCENGKVVPDEDKIARDTEGYNDCVTAVNELIGQRLLDAERVYEMALQAIDQEGNRLLRACEQQFDRNGALYHQQVYVCQKFVRASMALNRAAALTTYSTMQAALGIALHAGYLECSNLYPCHR